MGRATRWLRSLWGGKKQNKDSGQYSSYAAACAGEDDRKEKKRWSFTKSARDHPGSIGAPCQNEPSVAAVESAWFRSFYADNETEHSKHAIAVAAATAAAADAAVAAAQAAVAVVRLTSQGRAPTAPVQFVSASARERMAAVKIQTAFRTYLAKKALRALKALVKLQALMRGYLVRKQATATLRSMQALIRAQASVRSQRNRARLPHDRRYPPEVRPRSSSGRSDETRSEQLSSFHSRRLSGCLDGFDRSPKIVEMDTCRPRSRSSRRSSSIFDAPEDSNSNSNSNSMSSPLPCQVPLPAQISVPDVGGNFQDYDWCIDRDKCRFSATAQSTPRYHSSRGNGAATPAKSICSAGDGAFRRFSNDPSCPNYMANTQSFEAKVRSQSAPKQRPEPAGTRRRLPLSEVMVESRTSLSGVGMQRSCSRAAQESFSFKSAVVGKLDKSSDYGRETARDLYLHRKW